MPGLTPRDASAALALVTAATEERYEIVGFFAGTGGFEAGKSRPWHLGDDGLTPLAISPRQRLDDAVRRCPTCRSAAPTARCRCCTRRRRSGRSTRS